MKALQTSPIVFIPYGPAKRSITDLCGACCDTNCVRLLIMETLVSSLIFFNKEGVTPWSKT